MTSGWSKGSATMAASAAFPRSLAYITASVAGLAVFLFLASLLLVSNPLSSTVQGYFYKVDTPKVILPPVIPQNQKDSYSNVDVGDRKSPPSGSDFEVKPTSLSGVNGSVSESVRYSSPSGSESNVDVPDSNKERKEESVKEDVHVQVPAGNEEAKEEPAKKDRLADTKDLGIKNPASVDASTNKEAKVEPEKKDRLDDTKDLGIKNPASVEAATNKEAKVEPEKKDRLADTKDLGIKNPAIVDEEVSKGAKVAEASSVPSAADPKLKSGEEISAAASKEVTTGNGSDDSGCDLFKGTWFYDPRGPLYTNNSCPVITQMQNCQGNGRPDREYESYRWKPSQCDLPRFDAKKFLELMRGKTLAFIGDSVARNQMESLLCLLWQVEVPKNRGNKRMHRYYFRSTSTMIVRMWSSWLVHQTPEAIDFAPEGITKVHLDSPDENFMEFVPTFDVVVLSSGHWFAKQSVYVLNNQIVGGQLWWPDKSREAKINNIEAFGVSVETIVASMLTHPNFTGLTILRSYSPDHYEGGAWNTGGSCTGKTRPLEPKQLMKNDYTDIMHEKQMTGFRRGIVKKTNKSKFVMMDITGVFSYRHDGHPGPYRSLDPNKRTQFGPDGKPPPQDCLHWCMPGPIDTWNELVLEIIRREHEGKKSSSS
ncbi:unnamed protein product [Linum trigynum]|uniref:Trichome birefringence-like N-terminal domain-containing protein n=1 Tax=Linum trigynum TaxID=586398 RepID=A0AAV2G5V6_9ROSI